jgi:hypothetical protein
MTTAEGGKSTKKKQGSDSILKIVIPTAVTLILGMATFWIDHRISSRAEREQSSRLYTQLISQREQAASDLRKDMFKTILSGFLSTEKDDPIESSSKTLEEDLFKLELLALNFGDALSLGPIFTMMDRRIRTDDSYSSDIDRLLNKQNLHDRLTSLARRIGDGQRASLSSKAKSVSIDVPLDKMGEVGSFYWPASERDEQLSCLVLDGVQRHVSLVFQKPDKTIETIDVELNILTNKLDSEAPANCIKPFNECDEIPNTCVKYVLSEENPTDSRPFTIDQFNLPLIDSSLLSEDQRFALMLRSFSSKKAEIVAILFPGAYAGRRDKLTLDQAIEELKERLQ